MIAGLVGNVLVDTILQALLLHTWIPPLVIIMALTLVVAGVCATRWRWAPLLAVLWCVLSVIPGLEPYRYDLTHPAETGNFTGTLLSLVLLLVTVVAGVAAMISRTRQVAVDAAAPGATISVRPGTYTEQIIIAKDVTLKGDRLGNTIIQAPAALTPYAAVVATQAPLVAVVRITAGAHVTLSELTVTGPIPCGVGASGIHVANDATLRVKNARVTRIRPEQTCAGFVAGFGIGVGLPPSIAIDSQRGSRGHAIITNVSVDRYQDVGVEVVAPPGGAPSTATIINSPIATCQRGRQ